MKLNEEKKLEEIVDTYDGSHTYWEQMIELEKKAGKKDVIIPVIGMQGVGKSALINSILGEDILPSEVDETTCIPVEIRYGEEDAVIHYKNGTCQSTVCNKNELSQYVDNVYNPGNEKGISHIVISKKYDVLKSGIVIVDLPGVGSMTAANEETTMEYVKRVCAAVFVISTTPPIGKQESVFIKAGWRGFNSVYFVQNIWDDNTDSEKDEGLKKNKEILAEISKEIGGTCETEIIPINVYAAAKGRFTNDKELIKKSNLEELINKIADFSDHYTQQIEAAFNHRVENMVIYTEKRIEKEIHRQKISSDELLDELKDERKKYQADSEQVENILSDLNNKLIAYKRSSRQFAKTIGKNKAAMLETEIYKLIDKGVVDGKQLSTAFSEKQVEYAGEAGEEVYDELTKISNDFQKDIDELRDIVKEEMIFEAKKMFSFDKEEELKWEKGVGRTIGIGGAIGGGLFGLAVGGVPGVICGIIISISINVVGNLTEESVVEQRASETKDQLSGYITAYQIGIESNIEISFKKFFAKLSEAISNYQNFREIQLEKMNEQIELLIEKGNYIDRSIDKMEEDLNYVKRWRQEIYG